MFARRTVRPVSLTAFSAALVLTGLLAAAAHAARWPSNSPGETEQQRALAAALESTRVEFQLEREMRLSEVLTNLSDVSRVSVQLDRQIADDLRVPKARYLKDVSLGCLLDLLTRDLELAYLLHGDVILITSRETAAAHRELRIYSVANFPHHLKPDELVEMIGAMLDRLDPGAEEAEGDQAASVGERGIDVSGHLLLVTDNQKRQRLIGDFLESLSRSPPADSSLAAPAGK